MSNLVLNAIGPKSSRKELEAKRRVARKDLLIELANLRDDGLGRFHGKWKQLYAFYRDEDVLTRRDELRLLWIHRFFEATHSGWGLELPLDKPIPKRRYEVLYRQWRELHPNAVELPLTERNRSLYDQWVNYRYDESLEKWICDHWLSLKGLRFEVEWSENRKAIVTRGRRLPPTLVNACVHFASRFGFCRNPSCPAPYFFASRRDQLYCSNACAGPAKKAAKLKWWHEHRGRKTKLRKPRRL